MEGLACEQVFKNLLAVFGTGIGDSGVEFVSPQLWEWRVFWISNCYSGK